ncbi:uncharacterized protein LOC108672225 [Hyalella azteca]|uniref:Uncharacterized protein LOC108672225 n=1 Tax=Hyalella azteca TaxID=294128 RepID=A0A8B7NNV5_HYAAZ|nr:uncharacterized protein LOC108672225 [Hyalella azteca]
MKTQLQRAALGVLVTLALLGSAAAKPHVPPSDTPDPQHEDLAFSNQTHLDNHHDQGESLGKADEGNGPGQMDARHTRGVVSDPTKPGQLKPGQAGASGQAKDSQTRQAGADNNTGNSSAAAASQLTHNETGANERHKRNGAPRNTKPSQWGPHCEVVVNRCNIPQYGSGPNAKYPTTPKWDVRCGLEPICRRPWEFESSSKGQLFTGPPRRHPLYYSSPYDTTQRRNSG